MVAAAVMFIIAAAAFLSGCSSQGGELVLSDPATGKGYASYPMEAILRSEGIPRCECGGVIRPNIVLYGEPLEKYVCIGARREITNADTLIVAGTSLAVEPAASFIGDFRGKHLIVINRTPTPADEQAELVLREDVAEVFEALSRA